MPSVASDAADLMLSVVIEDQDMPLMFLFSASWGWNSLYIEIAVLYPIHDNQW
jgi:hypothetical protein